VGKHGATEHWFVVHNDEQPSLQTASFSRQGAIKYWLEAAGKSWRYWYRRGMRVRRVKIKWQVVR
jgi:hypothetical protein